MNKKENLRKWDLTSDEFHQKGAVNHSPCNEKTKRWHIEEENEIDNHACYTALKKHYYDRNLDVMH